MNKIFLATLFVFFLLFTSCTKDDKVEPIVTNPTFTSTSEARSLVLESIAGTSTVDRYEDSILISFEARNLTPGHVYILVVTTVDKPENCKTSPCTVEGDLSPNQSLVGSAAFQPDGLVADSSSVTFKVTIREKDNTTVPMFIYQTDLNVSLQDALKAEVHLGIRSKGPENVVYPEEQRTDTGARCIANWTYGESNARMPSKIGDCAWILESSHLAP